jgi:hypothetical protein
VREHFRTNERIHTRHCVLTDGFWELSTTNRDNSRLTYGATRIVGKWKSSERVPVVQIDGCIRGRPVMATCAGGVRSQLYSFGVISKPSGRGQFGVPAMTTSSLHALRCRSKPLHLGGFCGPCLGEISSELRFGRG